MNTKPFLRCGLPGLVLLCLSIGSAASDPPDSKIDVKPISGPETSKRCGNPVADEGRNVVADGSIVQTAVMPAQDSGTCDDSNPVTKDSCVAGSCVNELIIACPCAEDYAAAIAAYNARPGSPLVTWDSCDENVNRVGRLTARVSKIEPQVKGHFLTHVDVIWLVAQAASAVPASASFCDNMVRRFAMSFKDRRFGAKKTDISTAELATCETLIRAAAACPE